MSRISVKFDLDSVAYDSLDGTAPTDDSGNSKETKGWPLMIQNLFVPFDRAVTDGRALYS